MSKSVEEYLKILYPNIDSLNEEEQKKFNKDKNFLLEFFFIFDIEYNLYLDQINSFGEYEYTNTILQMCKDKLDNETIIINYVQLMFEMLNENSYISNNFESFMDLIRFEREQEEQLKNQPLDKTSIDLEKVFSLTEEFLTQIDDSQELVTEFRKLQNEVKIVVLQPKNKQKHSVYKDGIINYVFDGTVNTAYELLHEFMHHWTEIKAHPSYNREEHSMFLEFESIYYENAFIEFMDKNGLLKKGKEPLIASRLQRTYSKDPDNCILILLELCQNIKNNDSLNKDSITKLLKKYMPDVTQPEEIWSKGSELLSEFCEEHKFVGETINAIIMYRLNTSLVMQTPLNCETINNMYKLVPFIKDRIHDDSFMEQYTLMNTRKENLHILFSEVVQNALKTRITSEKIDEVRNIESPEQNLGKEEYKNN